MLRIICDAGADVNRPNKSGNPPIHLIAIMGYIKGAIALYESGSCDLFLKNSDGYTAYELACMSVKDDDILLTRYLSIYLSNLSN
jgi:ankyrin repeat protein